MINRNKDWWVKRVANEPDDASVGAGCEPPYETVPASRAGMVLLGIRAKFAWVWRIGLIKRTTAFRWEMDRFLGEWSK